MSTATDTVHAPEATPTSPPDPARIQAFAGTLLGTLSAGSIALMISIGHRTGLFDSMAGLPPATSPQVAAAAGLHERYVREWLAAMTTARIIVHDPTDDTYRLPTEHAAVLTRAAGPNNLSAIMQFVPLLSRVDDQVIRCFAEGGGVPYSEFTQFHQLMAELSAQITDATLVARTVPLVPGLPDQLTAGIRVADIGCGRGHAVNVLAKAFPNSEFVGYDFTEDAITHARTEANEWGLPNAHFEVRDVTSLEGTGTFGAIMAFDAIHDQAHPTEVLAQVATHLDAAGTFLMVDMFASSDLDKNLDLPHAPYLYTVSTMHCMTVSLALEGDGLGTAWGTELALEMLAEAGFRDVRVERLEEDFINSYYIARK